MMREALTADETFNPRAIERVFARMVRQHGKPGANGKRLDLQPLIADDGETDCWTHAWEVAQRTPGARYVEGLCHNGKALAQHAWVEEDTPFGPRLVECTPGYEEARDYVGIVVDHSPGSIAHEVSVEWERPRSSVMQAMIGGGIPTEQVLAMVQAREHPTGS